MLQKGSLNFTKILTCTYSATLQRSYFHIGFIQQLILQQQSPSCHYNQKNHITIATFVALHVSLLAFPRKHYIFSYQKQPKVYQCKFNLATLLFVCLNVTGPMPDRYLTTQIATLCWQFQIFHNQFSLNFSILHFDIFVSKSQREPYCHKLNMITVVLLSNLYNNLPVCITGFLFP